MRKLKQLTTEEVMFVGGETDKVYQHTAALILLDSSDNPGFNFEVYRQHLEERLERIPQFHWRLHEVPLGLDLPYWVEDESFSFDHHIRRIAVPSPGDRAALTELVAHLYCKHMDRSRPLWEAWFIEGLADGKFAIVQMQHHCMMDGEGASKLVEAMCDFTPHAPPAKVDPHITEAQPGEVPERWRQSLNTARHLSRLPLEVGQEALDVFRQVVWQRITHWRMPGKSATAPMACFNGDISGDRGFVFGSLPFEDIKTVKNHFGVTVNDVVLALVGSSLRDYLQQRNALPEESLRTSIAISLRTEADDEFSNKVTATGVTLATCITDPVERLQAIAEDTEAAKQKARKGNKGVMEIVQIFPPLLVNAMVNMAPPEQVIEMAGVNLVVSNVRGSPRPMYVGGSRIIGMYPMSIIAPGSGLNVTCVSYAGNVDFGITIAPELVPDPWLIIEGLHRALGYYLGAASKDSRPAKKARGKSAARKKTGVSRKAAAGRKAAASNKTAARKKTAASKKTAAARKTAAGKKTAAARKTATSKKTAAARKTATPGKAAASNKSQAAKKSGTPASKSRAKRK